VAAFASIDAYLARHVWVVEILRRGELFAPRAAAIFPWVLDRFGELGLDDEQATDAYATPWWFVLGHLSYLPSVSPERRAERQELMAANVVVAPLAGRLGQRVPASRLLAGGFALIVVSFALTARVGPDSSWLVALTTD
jgi:hypothetical protein